MALEDYRKKRDFKKTPEPSGDAPLNKKSKGDELFFCVQKHLASHLHYDFRLEWNGVLLSWAVPKGPSIDSKDKRLAMQTEDHPFDYGMFEGVIPEGYGAGIVMLWDYGTWEPESEDVDAALRKGDLKFRLNGYKLKGSWVIVKTHGYGGAPNSWLLIKHKDDWSGPDQHHRVCAIERQDAERGLRRDPVREDAGPVAQQRAGEGRRHRRDVQEDHRARAVDEGAEDDTNVNHGGHGEHEGKDSKCKS